MELVCMMNFVFWGDKEGSTQKTIYEEKETVEEKSVKEKER